MKKQNQSGFTIVEGIVVVVVMVAFIGVGYYVWQKHKITPTTPRSVSNSYQSPSVTTLTAPQVSNAADLNTAMQVLNQTSISSSNTDSSQLSTQVSGF